jgi:hypothetical protein
LYPTGDWTNFIDDGASGAQGYSYTGLGTKEFNYNPDPSGLGSFQITANSIGGFIFFHNNTALGDASPFRVGISAVPEPGIAAGFAILCAHIIRRRPDRSSR